MKPYWDFIFTLRIKSKGIAYCVLLKVNETAVSFNVDFWCNLELMKQNEPLTPWYVTSTLKTVLPSIILIDAIGVVEELLVIES